MYVWWYQLECAVVGRDCFLECPADFVVEDVQCWCLSGRAQAGVDIVVCSDAMAIVFGCKWAHEDGIGWAVECDHDVLIAAAGTRRETSCIVREDAVDWDDVDLHR